MASQYDLPYTGPQVEALLAKISELESEMPSKTSDLTNDSGFITSSDVPTKTSDLNNDSGFITNAPVAAEAARAQAAEALLATISSLQAEISRATGVEGTLQDLIDGIAAKIPSAATEQNQLADKAFVNSSIATASATFRGTYISLVALQAVAADENDYGYVISTDAVGNTIYNRYKYANSTWTFEYAIANPIFDSSQWAAINSAVTAELVAKLSALPDNETLTAALAAKQDVIDDLSSIRSKANSAYQKPAGGIPKTDLESGVQSSLGKADSAVQESAIADNLTTDDAKKVLSAKQGAVLAGQVSQLGQELYGGSSENILPYQEYSEIDFGTTWGGNADNIYYDTRLLIDPTHKIKKVAIFRQASGTLKVYFIKKSDLSIVTYKEVTMTSTAGFQEFDITLEDAYYANGEMYVGINGSTYFGSKTDSSTTSFILSISTGTKTSTTKLWGILITTETVSNGDIQDIQSGISALQAKDTELEGQIADINDVLYKEVCTPSDTWISGSFTVQGGGDAQYAFLDDRTEIPVGVVLNKVRMKAVANKTITIYLLKSSDYSVLASEVKSVTTGINDITPNFDQSLFSVPTYIAIGSADSPIAMRDTNGTSEVSHTTRVTLASGSATTGRRYIIALEVTYTKAREAGEISPDLATAIAQGGNDIVLGPYDYAVKSPITLTSGMTIRGSFGKTRLILTDGCQTAITASNADGIKISDLEIVGTCPNYTVEMNGIVAGTGYDLVETEADAVALNYMGTEKGIYLYYCENVALENLRINHITGSAIRVNHTGMDYTKGLNACNLFITNCYNGIYAENEHEFSQYTNWTVTSCMIGVYVASGNLIFTAGHATRCRFAMMFVSGTNHAHGVVNGIEIKHNQVAGIFCNGVVYGEFFEGIYLSYSPLVIRDSTGVYFDDVMVGNMSIDVTGTTGVNKIGKLVKRNNGISMVNTDTLTILETVQLY